MLTGCFVTMDRLRWKESDIQGSRDASPLMQCSHPGSYNNCQEEALISHCAEASLRNWITKRKKKKKNCEYVPCYQNPKRDLGALPLLHYEWRQSPVRQSWKYTFRKHNKKMKRNDMTQFMPFSDQVRNLSNKQSQLLNLDVWSAAR